MNEAIKAVILGIVQGLSEFLPISSSGHLVLFEQLLDFHESGLAFEVFVHFGTLVAVMVVFRKDIWKMVRTLPGLPGFILGGLKVNNEEDQYKALSFFIIIGTIPAGAIGLLFEDQVNQLFADPLLVLFALLVTGIVMWSSRYTMESYPFLNWGYALLIGFAQAFAIIPGISRSGSTIVTALWLGVKRDLAARFSFLLSVPVILGASIIKFKDVLTNPLPENETLNLVFGTVAAAVSGYFAIIWLLKIIRKQKLEWFGVYCAAVSIIGILLILFYAG